MDQSEYDKKYKSTTPIPIEIPGDDLVQSIDVDGSSVAPLNLTVVNSSPQERYQREMDRLQEKIQVVGHIPGGVDLIRRVGGADTAGSEAWRNLMRKCGRLNK
jgi:hypothetical protein